MDLILKSRLSFCSAILRVWIIAGDFLAARHLAAWWNSFGQRSCLVLCKAPGGTGTVPADSEEQTYTGAAHWNHWNQRGHLLHAQPWRLTWSFQEICSLSKFRGMWWTWGSTPRREGGSCHCAFSWCQADVGHRPDTEPQDQLLKLSPWDIT